MRDIRDDLIDRLKALSDDKRRLQAELKALDAQEAAVRALLAGEDRRFGGEPLPLGDNTLLQSPPTAPTSQFRRFVLECLGNGAEWSLSRMSRQAVDTGLVATMAEGRSIGRSLHAALLGLKQQGLVEIPSPGHWKLVRPRLLESPDQGAA